MRSHSPTSKIKESIHLIKKELNYFTQPSKKSLLISSVSSNSYSCNRSILRSSSSYEYYSETDYELNFSNLDSKTSNLRSNLLLVASFKKYHECKP